MTPEEFKEIETVWRCRGGSFPRDAETVGQAIDALFADYRRLRRDRARHLTLILSLVDALDEISTTRLRSVDEGERLHQRVTSLIAACNIELAEGHAQQLERELLKGELHGQNASFFVDLLDDLDAGEPW